MIRVSNVFGPTPEFPAISLAKFPVGKRRVLTTAYLQLDGDWLPWWACTCIYGEGDPLECAIDYHRFRAVQRHVAAECGAA